MHRAHQNIGQPLPGQPWLACAREGIGIAMWQAGGSEDHLSCSDMPACIGITEKRGIPLKQEVPRTGARPLLLAGSAAGAAGMFWLSRISEHSTYAGGLLGPLLLPRARSGEGRV